MSSLPDELLKLRRLLLSMGAQVEQRVGHALEALLRHDLRLAEAVREGDDEIDRFDLSVEAECVEIIALHHPVARDLRYVLAALRINSDLEKIADLARGIAKKAIKLEYLPKVDRPPELIAMAKQVTGMLADALQALTEQDAQLAYGVRRTDREVDMLHKEMMAWTLRQVASGEAPPKPLLDMVSVVRSLERIADLSTNIAEAVVFSVEGAVIRHLPVETGTKNN
jgi:phosphate transport system protein